MPFLQLSPKSPAQQNGEWVASLYHHSQGGAVEDFKAFCCQQLKEALALSECVWLIAPSPQTQWVFNSMDELAESHPCTALFCDAIQLELTHAPVESSIDLPQNYALFSASSLKGKGKVVEQIQDLSPQSVLCRVHLAEQGVVHYFALDSHSGSTDDLFNNPRCFNAISHVVEAFRLHLLSAYRRHTQCRNLLYAVSDLRGTFYEVDEIDVQTAHCLQTHLSELMGQNSFMHCGESCFFRAENWIVKVERVLDSLFYQCVAVEASLVTLTPKEYEVCFYLQQALSNRQIAQKMQVSLKTVENHLANIYEKHEKISRSELFALLHGS